MDDIIYEPVCYGQLNVLPNSEGNTCLLEITAFCFKVQTKKKKKESLHLNHKCTALRHKNKRFQQIRSSLILYTKSYNMLFTTQLTVFSQERDVSNILQTSFC